MSCPFEKKQTWKTALQCIKDYERAMKIFQINDVDLTEGEIRDHVENTLLHFTQDGKLQETRLFQDHPIC